MMRWRTCILGAWMVPLNCTCTERFGRFSMEGMRPFEGEGATTKEVAQRLGISVKTAQAHRDNLKQKLELRSTAAIVRYAIKHKLIRID